MGALTAVFALTAGDTYPSAVNVEGVATSIVNIDATAATGDSRVVFKRGGTVNWEWRSHVVVGVARLSLYYNNAEILYCDPITNQIYLNNEVHVLNKFSCNGQNPQASVTVNAASTDLATVVALTNQLRAALVANGICA